jgi:DNA transposition AAA+ family ATPase
MGLVTGPPGFGKTFAAQYLQNRYDAYRIECNSVMNRKSLMIYLLREQMGITPAKTMPEMLEQIVIQMQESERPLIIDEFDYLVDKGAIEIIRDIHDGSGNCPILLIGEENLAQKLDKWERFSRRILDKVTVQPLSIDDAWLLANHYCGNLEIAEDLLAYFHTKSSGSAGRIRISLGLAVEKALSLGVERLCLADWPQEPKGGRK